MCLDVMGIGLSLIPDSPSECVIDRGNVSIISEGDAVGLRLVKEDGLSSFEKAKSRFQTTSFSHKPLF